MRKKIKQISTITIILITFLAIGCQEKFDLANLPVGTIINVGDTTYIEIVPPFTGFNNPTALFAGYDQLIYIADTDNNRIIQMNEAGVILETRSILKPIAISQDLRLDLLVSGEMINPANGDTIGAIFRIKLFEAAHHLAQARLDTIYRETAKPRRRFRGIGLLQNNQYLVVRDGADNASFIDPDTRVLLFGSNDKLITPVGDLSTRAGSGITDILRTTGIVTFPNSNDFVLSQSSADGQIIYGALWMIYQKNAEFDGWLPKFNPAKPEERYIDFIKPTRFEEATSVTIDRARLDIFMVDSALDSLVKFDRRGRYKPESFGKSMLASLNRPSFKSPKGVTFLGKTLYVADSGNNMVRRFRLSTDR